MIRRLDSHEKPNFTTVEGRQPYFSKYTTPLIRLEYANSVTINENDEVVILGVVDALVRNIKNRK